MGVKGGFCRYMDGSDGWGLWLRTEERKAYYGIARGKARYLREHNGTDCLCTGWNWMREAKPKGKGMGCML